MTDTNKDAARMTDKEKVLAVHPDAQCVQWGGRSSVAILCNFEDGTGGTPIGYGDTQAIAWADAASKLAPPVVEREEAAEDKHEREMLEVIDQRDRAEEALSQAYFLITGRSPEWSNLFGYDEALEEIDDAQQVLRKSIAK